MKNRRDFNRLNRLFFLIWIALSSIGFVHGQDSLSAKKTKFTPVKYIFSVGYGYSPWISDYGKPADKRKQYGPIHFDYLYTFKKQVFSLGASINYLVVESSKDYYYYTQTGSGYRKYYFYYLSTAINFRCEVSGRKDKPGHFFWGIGLGLKFNYKLPEIESNDLYLSEVLRYYFPVGFETTLGYRYKMSDRLGFYIEGGVAKSVIQGGVFLHF
ncbi:MAG: hypothetical protein JXR34_13655 [Bacteroidales bacterium]|nr:hypothetical protein [Bacteroidales bacterium]